MVHTHTILATIFQMNPGWPDVFLHLLQGGSVVYWLWYWSHDSMVASGLLAAALSGNNLRQVVYTHVPLSASSINW